MTWSVATPRWVLPDASIESTLVTTPRVAAISVPPALFLEGWPKWWRNSS